MAHEIYRDVFHTYDHRILVEITAEEVAPGQFQCTYTRVRNLLVCPGSPNHGCVGIVGTPVELHFEMDHLPNKEEALIKLEEMSAEKKREDLIRKRLRKI